VINLEVGEKNKYADGIFEVMKNRRLNELDPVESM